MAKFNESDHYQVGGSLPGDANSYVTRQADADFFAALSDREYCYVLNARQMGKSSLRVRTMQRLQAEGVTCAFVDLSGIGRQGVTPEKWYAGLVNALVGSLQLSDRINWRQWWRSQRDLLSPIQRFQVFIDEIVLTNISGNIVIFIDEIDRILSQDFCLDDFFALIRAFYNYRVDSKQYQRLTIAFLGVAMPSDLIIDKTQTPFNIGKAITLRGFQPQEAYPLEAGLGNQKESLTEILHWTGGQPFLTQKVCQLVAQAPPQSVANIVQASIINNWERQDEPEHLRTIRDRLLHNENKRSQLLGLYQQILQQGRIAIDSSSAQMELQLSGLVIKQSGYLKVANKIYQHVFTQNWVTRNLQAIRPYRETMAAWLAANRKDTSRLLQGQALQTAIAWKANKHLSAEDEAFLTASQTHDKRLVQKQLAVEQQAKQVLAKANQEAKRKIEMANRRMGIGSAVLVSFVGLAVIAAVVASRTVAIALRERNELGLVIQSLETEKIVQMQPLDALINALETTRQLKQMQPPPAPESEAHQQAIAAFQHSLSEVKEYNRIHVSGRVNSVHFSPDGSLLAAGNENSTIQIWRSDGTLLHTLTEHEDYVWSVRFSPNGQQLASVSRDGTMRLWDVATGTLTRTIAAHDSEVRGLSFSPNGELLASSSAAGEVKLWNAETGREINKLAAHANRWVNFVSFSPEGNLLASASQDGTVKLWNIGPAGEGNQLVKTFKHGALVRSVGFNDDGQQLVSAGADGNIKRWDVKTGDGIDTLSSHNNVVWDAAFLPGENADTRLVSVSNDESLKLWNLINPSSEPQTLLGHRGAVRSVAASPDGQTIASAGTDQTIRLWRTQGAAPITLNAHNSQPVWSTQFSPTGQVFASAGKDDTVKIWRADDQQLVQELPGHHIGIQHIAFSADGKMLAAAGKENTVNLWNIETGELVYKLSDHTKTVRVTAFSPDGEWLASAGNDRTIKLWRIADGKAVMTLTGHRDRVHDIHFSPDSQHLASASFDRNVILWRIPDGERLQTLQGHTTRVTAVRFSPDGQQLATGSGDTTIRLWQTSTGELLNTLKGNGWVRGLAFHPAGTRLAAANHGGTVQLWDSATGDLLETLIGNADRIEDVGFSPDGKTLAAASQNGTVRLWQLERTLTDWETTACEWLQEYFETNPSELSDACSPVD